MKILVKTVASKDRPMEVIIDDAATVKDLIDSLLKDHSYKATKLVFKGTVLGKPDRKLSEEGVVDGEYCVVIGAKATGAAATASKAAEEKKKEEAAKEPEKDKAGGDKKEPAASAPAATGAQSSEASAAAAGALVTGDELDETIAVIMGMNDDWPKELVTRALHAAFNNPNRAVEFLLSGNIPARDPAPAPAQPAATGGSGSPAAPQPAPGTPAEVVIPGVGTLTPQQIVQIMAIINQRPGQPPPDQRALAGFLSELAQASQGFAAGGQPGSGGGGSGAPQQQQQGGGGGQQLSPLAQSLSRIAEFDQIRSLVAQDGSQLSRVMMTIRDQDPELFAMVQQNQEEFLRLLREGIPGGSNPPGTRTVTITEADRQVIERLMQLGFSREEVLQAYMAADRNEELAADLLFDSNPMDQD